MVRGMVRLKDIVTLGNLLCGVVAILFCIEHRVDLAAGWVMFAYLFDALDGVVARRTGGGNRFGAELDNLADYVAFAVAPAFVIYAAYRPTVAWLGALLGGAMVVAATLRHVRNLVFDVPTQLCWVGLPRPAAGMLVVALLRSKLFHGIGPWLGAPLLGAVAWALLATYPSLNHRGRTLQTWVRALGSMIVISWVTTLLVLPQWFWDTVFVTVFAYASLSWTGLEPQELAAFRQSVATWKLKLRS